MLNKFLFSFIFVITNLVLLTPVTFAGHDPKAEDFVPGQYCDENEIWQDNTHDTGHTFFRYCAPETRCEKLEDDGSGVKKVACVPVNPIEKTKPFEKGPDAAGLKQIEGLFRQIIQVSVGLAFVALLVVLVIASIKFLTSGGEPKAIASAKEAVTWGILGIVFMILAWLILQLIAAFTGVEVLKTFDIRTLCIDGIPGCD